MVVQWILTKETAIQILVHLITAEELEVYAVNSFT